MLTIKTSGHNPVDRSVFVGMEIFHADQVQSRHGENGQLYGLTLFTAAQNTMNGEAFEHVLVMDADGVAGPATVYVENAQGRTVQRFNVEPLPTD